MFVLTANLLIRTEQLAKTIKGIDVKRLPSSVLRLNIAIISFKTGLTAVIGALSPPAIRITTNTLRSVKPILFFLLIIKSIEFCNYY